MPWPSGTLPGSGLASQRCEPGEVARVPDEQREHADGEQRPAPGGAEQQPGEGRGHGERREREQGLAVDQSVRKP